MLAIGNEQLGDPVKKGDLIVNAKLNIKGALSYGTDESGKESPLLGFVSSEDKSYLVSINNKLIPGWEISK
jgi:hypothetical protein